MRKAIGPCNVEACGNMIVFGRGMCKRHYSLWYKHGRTHNVNRPAGSGWHHHDGYKRIYKNGRIYFEHVWLAELALGKPLPAKAVVHHMNEVKDDNYTYFNLVICPNQKYHFLLHKRAKEYELFGHCITTD